MQTWRISSTGPVFAFACRSPPSSTFAAIIGPRPFRSRSRALRTRSGSVVVRDSLSALGTTSQMGTRDLLDAVDRASAAASGKASTGATTRPSGGDNSSASSSPSRRRGAQQRLLWERLSCRAQALLPDFTAAELCRVLFAFHRARHQDEGLLDAACEAILTEPLGQTGILGNDAVLLFKALSRHRHRHTIALEHLLKRVAEQCDSQRLTASDVAQLMVAILRLDMADHVRLEGLDQRLFAVARGRLADAYLPAQDVTNLCTAAVLFGPSEDGARLLEAAARRFEGPNGQAAAALTPPKDLVRRLLSFGAFDAALQERKDDPTSVQNMDITPMAARWGSDRLVAICRCAAKGLSQRASEIDPETCVVACEAMAQLLPKCDRIDAAFWKDNEFGPVLYLVLHRLPTMQADLQRRMAKSVPALEDVARRQRVRGPGPPVPVLAEISAALRCVGAAQANREQI
eukprot:TRINITY_DN43781_c0_g1_i1.p1 TRINITY_DN43781_c0_g1~~TRINITY_DN43781_c0_g1_i1.p1  ORF type:complete len:494 (+),score=64.52 TRINITY_DN43781_c0_g1_i1:104-1483(+)